MKIAVLPLALLAASAVYARPDGSADAREEEIQRESQQVDHVFLMDCTGSMSSYIETAKEKILGLVKSLKSKYPKMKLRLGFIGYRDIDDWEGSKKDYISVPFTEDHDEFRNQIMSVEARGGGDRPEDVWTGLKASVELNWKSNVRMMTLLSDAPHNELSGRKKYSDFQPLLEKLGNTGTDNPFIFTFFKIGGNCGDLGDKIKSMVPSSMNYVEHDLPVASYYYPRRSYGTARAIGPGGMYGRRGMSRSGAAIVPMRKASREESMYGRRRMTSMALVPMRKEEAEEAPDKGYMSDLEGYIGTAIDSAAKRMSDSEE